MTSCGCAPWTLSSLSNYPRRSDAMRLFTAIWSRSRRASGKRRSTFTRRLRMSPELRTVVLFLAAAMLPGCREPAEQELDITSSEYGFHMPDSVPAGLVHITLHNVGGDIHEAALV